MGDLLEVTEEMKSVFQTAYNNNRENLDKAILELRQSGYTNVKIVLIFMTELKLTLEEAHLLLSGSGAWNQ
jgi:hypothetical protein